MREQENRHREQAKTGGSVRQERGVRAGKVEGRKERSCTSSLSLSQPPTFPAFSLCGASHPMHITVLLRVTIFLLFIILRHRPFILLFIISPSSLFIQYTMKIAVYFIFFFHFSSTPASIRISAISPPLDILQCIFPRFHFARSSVWDPFSFDYFYAAGAYRLSRFHIFSLRLLHFSFCS